MKKILSIEDEASLQKTFVDVLGEEGYQVVSALDGEIGLRLAKSEKPDLILLDLMLPKIHGLDVLRQLRASPETKDIPVIILTNLDQTENVKDALELGATTYLIKSNYSLQDVLEKIKKALNEI